MQRSKSFIGSHKKLLLSLFGVLIFSLLLLSFFVYYTPSTEPRGEPINLDPVVALDPIGEDEFDTRLAEPEIEAKLYELGSEEDPQARERWFWEQRAYPAKRVPVEQYRAAVLAELNEVRIQAADTITWTEIGPNPIVNENMGGTQNLPTVAGRAISVAVHPINSNIILAGAAQGGIWRSTDGGATFSPVGDNLPSMAIKVIRFAPSDLNTIYAGSGEPHASTSIYGMGLFKSTDGGQTWVALPTNGAGWDFRNVSVSGIQVDPTNANTVYVTTANVKSTIDFFLPFSTPQTGIFKSTDGGQTWVRKQDAIDYQKNNVFDDGGVGFMDLEIFLQNPTILYATEMLGGIYRSTDSGETWTLMTPLKDGGNGDPAARGPDFPAAVATFSRYDSNNATFTTLNVLPQVNNTPEFHRIDIALAQSGGGIDLANVNTYILYAAYGTTLTLDDGSANGVQIPTGLIFKSTDGGQTWAWLGDWGNQGVPNYCRDQCGYDNMIEVNPLNPNDVIIGGSANFEQLFPDPPNTPTRILQNKPWSGMVYRTIDGGTTWVDTTPQCSTYTDSGDVMNALPLHNCTAQSASKVIHVDLHAGAYDPLNSRFYVVSDGGLYRATISGSGANSLTDYTWEALNGSFSTLQFYNFGSHPTSANQIIGGLQDNSVVYWNGTIWDSLGTGDGNVGRFDPNNPTIVYAGVQKNLNRNDTGPKKTSGFQDAGWKAIADTTLGAGDQLPFITVFDIDPVSPNNIYIASTTGVYRSTDRGDNWQGRLNGTATNGEPTTISVSPKDNNVVWAGTSKGQILRFNIGDSQVTDVTAGNLPNRYITKIKASPNDANAVYVTFSGYDANSADMGKGGNGNVGRVFKSTDSGQTWTNISGNLTQANSLDIPVSALAVDPADENKIWIGTDTGVFITENGGTAWESYRNNMPVVVIMALEYNSSTDYLMAATHGRGIWRVKLGTRTGASIYLPLIIK